MRHFFLAGVLAVAIMGCEGEGGCEVQESEIDCFEAMQEIYRSQMQDVHMQASHVDDPELNAILVTVCDLIEALQDDGCEAVIEVPVYCDEVN